MESPSVPDHREAIPWWELLFTVSLLTLWNSPTTAQIKVESVPPEVAEGNRVLLLVHNMPQNSTTRNWYKNETKHRNIIITLLANPEAMIPGPAYSGRETLYSNGSLLIQNLTKGDTGIYIIRVLTENFKTFYGTGQLHVHQGSATDIPVGTFLGIVIGVLIGVKLTVALGYFLFFRRSERSY